MAYSLKEQYALDINWYFTDIFNRLCVATSAGGVLPSIIAINEEKNNYVHNITVELPQIFEFRRNQNVIEQIQGLNPELLNEYFADFDTLASKGLYVYDRLNLDDSNNTEYVLVAYPIYRRGLEKRPFDKNTISILPKIKGSIIYKRGSNIYPSSFTPKNLNKLINKCKSSVNSVL